MFMIIVFLCICIYGFDRSELHILSYILTYMYIRNIRPIGWRHTRYSTVAYGTVLTHQQIT